MRFSRCAVLLSVCIVALQCGANANDVLTGDRLTSEGSDNAVVATTTTTAAQKISTPDVTIKDSERERSTGGDLEPDRDATVREEPVPFTPAKAEKTKTTTTAVNVVPPRVDNHLDNAKTQQQLAAEQEPEVQGADKTGEKEKTPVNVNGPREAAPIVEEAEVAAQTPTTTTASVNSLPLSDNSQTGVQPPRTNTVVQTNSSPQSTPEREVAPGGLEPGKKNVGAQAKTPGEKTISQERGAHASVPVVKNAAVTPLTNIVKKNNGADAGVQPNKNSEDKEIHQKQTPDSSTTITEEQKASTESSTTSSAAPTKETSPGMTSTLPKGFKIPQSMDKTDGTSSVYLWFAFATLVTLAVTAVAPVH